MPEDLEHKRAEVVIHQGKKYVRINPEDINLDQMTLVQRVTDVVAGQISQGRVKVITKHGKEIETINYANAGDWVLYDFGGNDFKNVFFKIIYAEKHAIAKENFPYLYRAVDFDLGLTAENILALIQDFVMDNQDNKDFDGSFINNLRRYKYIGKPVYAGYVPFNFVIRTVWGEDQFIKRGGLIIYDSNFERQRFKKVFETEAGRKNYEKENGLNIYGMEGAHNRVPGIFEKTFSLGVGGETKVIADTFKMVIQADRSPIAGIQFNNVDLAKAYDRAGKRMPEFLQKFLD